MMWLALLCALGVLAGFLLCWRIPSCHVGAQTHARKVSIIIPARNEERNLPHLLQSVVDVLGPTPEVIVVDDGSTDETVTVALFFRARVVPSKALPTGWTGKTWACWQGAASATSDLLLFLDADTRLEPNALLALVEAQEAAGSLQTAVSVVPYHAMENAYEQLSLVFNLLMAFGAGGFGLLSRPRLFGQSLLLSRALYQACGGHAAVRNQILENFMLAPLVTAAGGRCLCVSGRGLLNVRMFPDGFSQLREGWTKAFADGAAATDPKVLAVSIVWLTLQFTTFLMVLLAPDAWRFVFGAVYLGFAAQIFTFARAFGNFRVLTCVFFPVPLVFFFAVFADSLYRRVFKRRVTWRGRSL